MCVCVCVYFVCVLCNKLRQYSKLTCKNITAGNKVKQICFQKLIKIEEKINKNTFLISLCCGKPANEDKNNKRNRSALLNLQ